MPVFMNGGGMDAAGGVQEKFGEREGDGPRSFVLRRKEGTRQSRVVEGLGFALGLPAPGRDSRCGASLAPASKRHVAAQR
jgi:hypothetical protein